MRKQLYRSKKNRILGGVASGIADYFDIDPVIIRIVFVIMAFAWGLSIAIYIVLWIITPYQPCVIDIDKSDIYVDNDICSSSEEMNYNNTNKHKQGHFIFGTILITLGTLLLLNKLFIWFSFSYVWPLLVIALGILIIIKPITVRINKGE